MGSLQDVKKGIPEVVQAVSFNEGNRYSDFDSKVDNVAAWTIGGLVAGKIASKVGLLAIIAKFGKVGIIALLAGLGAIFNFLKNLIFKTKKEEEIEVADEESNQSPIVETNNTIDQNNHQNVDGSSNIVSESKTEDGENSIKD